MSPQPWARTGREHAKDGKPRFDLERFDEAYFSRLRDRVEKARDRGIYVGVLLFDGWALHLSPAPDNIEGHPFHAANNGNGIAATSIDDLQVLPLDPRMESIEAAYIKKVVDRSTISPMSSGRSPTIIGRRQRRPGVRQVPGHGRAAGMGRSRPNGSTG